MSADDERYTNTIVRDWLAALARAEKAEQMVEAVRASLKIPMPPSDVRDRIVRAAWVDGAAAALDAVRGALDGEPPP